MVCVCLFVCVCEGGGVKSCRISSLADLLCTTFM
jgi:hypothetical protein